MFPASTISSLKRTRSKSRFNASDIPLPKIQGDLVLSVFTHPSLGRSMNDDNSTLAELGKSALEACVTCMLFKRRPYMEAAEMVRQREELLCDESYDTWVSGYGMRQKVRCIPAIVPSLMQADETRNIFHAYVGAVMVEAGLDGVERWMGRLIEGTTGYQDGPPPPPPPRMAAPPPPAGPPPMPSTPPPPKKIKSEYGTPPLASVFQQQSAHSVYRVPQAYNYSYNPLAPAQPGLAFLPIFNQTATQRRVNVEYRAEFTGPSHAGKWTVECVVNGIPKGIGTGGSKQVAKEEAARQAYYAMGWA